MERPSYIFSCEYHHIKFTSFEHKSIHTMQGTVRYSQHAEHDAGIRI